MSGNKGFRSRRGDFRNTHQFIEKLVRSLFLFRGCDVCRQL